MARLPRKKSFTLDIDLLADWRSYADEPPVAVSTRDWRYFGAVTYNGVSRKSGQLSLQVGSRCGHSLRVSRASVFTS
jgi:hypothetical protein